MINRNSKNMKKTTTSRTSDLNEKIQKKAYELYVKRGCTQGNDMADWLEAERIVKSGRF